MRDHDRRWLMLLVCLAGFTSLGGCSKIVIVHPTAESLAGREGFTWDVAETPHFTLRAEADSTAAESLPTLGPEAEASRLHALELLGETEFDARISVFTVDTRERMTPLIGRPTLATAFNQTNVVCLVVSEHGRTSIRHEVFHVVAANLWGVPERWINEGFAVYAAGPWQGRDLDGVVRYLLDTEQLVPVTRLPGTFRSKPRVAYPQAGSFIKFLYETYGRADMRLFWDRGAQSARWIYGRTLGALEAQWIETLRDVEPVEIRTDDAADVH